mgnify:CR=1 FL=1
MPKGGKRIGAGRPRIDNVERKQRQLRSSDEEWELLKAFDKILKYGDKQAARSFINQHKVG